MKKALACLFVASVAAFAAGCGEEETAAPEEPEDKVGAVKQALEEPSGTVDESSVADVHARYDRILRAELALDAVALAFDGAGASCSPGASSVGDSVDVSCATGGSVSGTIEVKASTEAGGAGAQASVELVLHDVCDSAACVSGTVTIETSASTAGVSTTIAYSADVTIDGRTEHVFFGSETSVTSDAVLSRVAIWGESGESFVVESSVDGSGSSFSITGENGSFECTADQGGGHCSGAGEIDF